MTRKQLQELGLEKDVIDSIMAFHGQSINAVNTRVTELETSVTSLNEQITARDNDLTALRETASNSDEVQKALDTLQAQYDTDKTTHAEQLANVRKSSAIELSLVKSKAKNSKAVQALLDSSKIEFNEDGTVTGIDEQLTKLKESDAYLFETEPNPEPEGKKPIFRGGNPTSTPEGGKTSWKDKIAQNLK